MTMRGIIEIGASHLQIIHQLIYHSELPLSEPEDEIHFEAKFSSSGRPDCLAACFEARPGIGLWSRRNLCHRECQAFDSCKIYVRLCTHWSRKTTFDGSSIPSGYSSAKKGLLRCSIEHGYCRRIARANPYGVFLRNLWPSAFLAFDDSTPRKRNHEKGHGKDG